VNSLNTEASRWGLMFLVVAIILCAIVIISIDNTIRLAMFSNRFLIKTMQMVGATRWFIVKPMDLKAIINGLISAAIAIAILLIMMKWAENQVPQLKALHNTGMLLTLFGGMILIGVAISVYSTHRSVMKYLKMKLDELY
jgi:cell division transport system permease protein